jgi:hypothetical protein
MHYGDKYAQILSEGILHVPDRYPQISDFHLSGNRISNKGA